MDDGFKDWYEGNVEQAQVQAMYFMTHAAFCILGDVTVGNSAEKLKQELIDQGL